MHYMEVALFFYVHVLWRLGSRWINPTGGRQTVADRPSTRRLWGPVWIVIIWDPGKGIFGGVIFFTCQKTRGLEIVDDHQWLEIW